jgi:phenylacetic acid degradation operon negative regulatory protein
MNGTVESPFRAAYRRFYETFTAQRPIHANSLILTLFGDSICPHGGEIWLGSLIRLVEPLGINQRLVRTSVFRLVEKGILQARQSGRRSYYSLTETGYRQFSTAAQRIYHHHEQRWDGEWRLVFTRLNTLDEPRRERFRKELQWLGFSRLAKGVYGHPTVSLEQLRLVTDEMGITDAVTVMRSRIEHDDPVHASIDLVRCCFQVEALKQAYAGFIRLFEPMAAVLDEIGEGDEESCFLLRSLLIHEFRHLLLKEPDLPAELFPADCLSHPARDLAARLYLAVVTPAERHFLAVAESEHGGLPAADLSFHQRFGGQR